MYTLKTTTPKIARQKEYQKHMEEVIREKVKNIISNNYYLIKEKENYFIKD